MNTDQREPNPDVNTYIPGGDPAGGEDPNAPKRDEGSNIGETSDEDIIPIPPDSEPAVPIEEPPQPDRVPVGDVDDSPKRIV